MAIFAGCVLLCCCIDGLHLKGGKLCEVDDFCTLEMRRRKESEGLRNIIELKTTTSLLDESGFEGWLNIFSGKQFYPVLS